MDPQNKSLVSQQQQVLEIEEKKALLVVGKMGHGKSSFIRMLFEERNDKKQYSQNVDVQIQKSPFIQTGVKNGTDQCYIYQSHKSHNLLPNNQSLFIIDSPGLDCDKSACLITEQVDDIILQNNLKIIGIAYVIDISQRQQGRTGISYFGQLIQLLKIKMKYKIQIIFCVCSKWDKLYDQEEGIRQNLRFFKQLLENNKCGSAFNKLIRWASKPINDFRKYKRFIQDKQGGGDRIVNNQWIELRRVLVQQIQKACPFVEYQKDYKDFWQNMMKQIMKLFHREDKKKAFQKVQSIFPVHITKNKKKIKKMSPLFTIITTGTINISRFSLAFAVPPLALTGPIGITILVASVVIGAGVTVYQIHKAIKKTNSYMSQSFQLKKSDQKAEQLKFSLQLKIKNKILNNLCDEMLNKLKKDEYSIKIPDMYWLNQQILAYYGTQIKQKSRPFARASKLQPKIKYQMAQGKNEVFILLKTQVWLPKFASIEEILKEQIIKIYQ